MKYSFTKRATNVPISGIAHMMRYGSQFSDVLSLGQGTPQFPTPKFIFDAVYKRSKKDPTLGMYADVKIQNELKNHIKKDIKRLYGFIPKYEELEITTGGIAGLFAAIMTVLEKGDEVIYFDPSYPLHISQIHIAEAKPKFVSLDEKNGWSLDFDKLTKSITKKTKAIILTNPNNPTGTVLTRKEVEKLTKIVLKNNLYLILDEAYEFLVFDVPFFSPLRISELRKHTILCKSFSKEFAMTGWRIGYMYAPKKLIQTMYPILLHYTVEPPTISIAGAITALSDRRGKQYEKKFVKEFTKSRNAICERLSKLPKLFSFQKPHGAYYVFPKYLHFKMSALDFSEKLCREAKVITIPGTSSGPAGKNHIRMSFACSPDVIHRAFDRIDTFAEKYGLR